MTTPGNPPLPPSQEPVTGDTKQRPPPTSQAPKFFGSTGQESSTYTTSKTFKVSPTTVPNPTFHSSSVLAPAWNSSAPAVPTWFEGAASQTAIGSSGDGGFFGSLPSNLTTTQETATIMNNLNPASTINTPIDGVSSAMTASVLEGEEAISAVIEDDLMGADDRLSTISASFSALDLASNSYGNMSADMGINCTACPRCRKLVDYSGSLFCHYCGLQLCQLSPTPGVVPQPFGIAHDISSLPIHEQGGHSESAFSVSHSKMNTQDTNALNERIWNYSSALGTGEAPDITVPPTTFAGTIAPSTNEGPSAYNLAQPPAPPTTHLAPSQMIPQPLKPTTQGGTDLPSKMGVHPAIQTSAQESIQASMQSSTLGPNQMASFHPSPYVDHASIQANAQHPTNTQYHAQMATQTTGINPTPETTKTFSQHVSQEVPRTAMTTQSTPTTYYPPSIASHPPSIAATTTSRAPPPRIPLIGLAPTTPIHTIPSTTTSATMAPLISDASIVAPLIMPTVVPVAAPSAPTMPKRVHPVATFGVGGVLLVSLPIKQVRYMGMDGPGGTASYFRPGPLILLSVAKLPGVQEQVIQPALSVFGNRPVSGKWGVKVKDVLTALEVLMEKVGSSSPSTLTSASIRRTGSNAFVSSSASTSGGSRLILLQWLKLMLSDLQGGAASAINLLYSSIRNVNRSDSPTITSPPQTAPITEFSPSIAMEMSSLLIKGDKAAALVLACSHQLWTHALVLASQMDGETFTSTISEFAKQNLSRGHPLRTAYLIFANQAALLGAELSQIEASNISNNWARHLALILANRRPDDYLAILGLGEALERADDISAAHFCYLLSDDANLLGGPHGPYTRIVYLSRDHGRETGTETCFWRNWSALRLTEALEFALRQAQSTFRLLYLTAYRLAFATWLSDWGQTELALRYLYEVEDAISSIGGSTAAGGKSPGGAAPITTMNMGSGYINELVRGVARQWIDRLVRNSGMNVAALGALSLSAVGAASGSGWLPKMGGMLVEAFDRGLTRVIGVEETRQAPPGASSNLLPPGGPEIDVISEVSAPSQVSRASMVPPVQIAVNSMPYDEKRPAIATQELGPGWIVQPQQSSPVQVEPVQPGPAAQQLPPHQQQQSQFPPYSQPGIMSYPSAPQQYTLPLEPIAITTVSPQQHVPPASGWSQLSTQPSYQPPLLGVSNDPAFSGVSREAIPPSQQLPSEAPVTFTVVGSTTMPVIRPPMTSIEESQMPKAVEPAVPAHHTATPITKPPMMPLPASTPSLTPPPAIPQNKVIVPSMGAKAEEEDLGFGNRPRTSTRADGGNEEEAAKDMVRANVLQSSSSKGPAASQPSATESGNGNEKKSMLGFLTGWFGKKGNAVPSGEISGGPKKANLGEPSTFRYDQKLGRWVDDKDPSTFAPSTPPPPPPATLNKPLSTTPGPPPTMPSGAASGYGGGMRGAGSRSRYIDPFNPQGTFTNDAMARSSDVGGSMGSRNIIPMPSTAGMISSGSTTTIPMVLPTGQSSNQPSSAPTNYQNTQHEDQNYKYNYAQGMPTASSPNTSAVPMPLQVPPTDQPFVYHHGGNN